MRKKMRTSQIMLVSGLVVLLAGCVLSYMKIEPWADYVLVAGAILVIFRGAVAAREKNDNDNQNNGQ